MNTHHVPVHAIFNTLANRLYWPDEETQREAAEKLQREFNLQRKPSIKQRVDQVLGNYTRVVNRPDFWPQST